MNWAHFCFGPIPDGKIYDINTVDVCQLLTHAPQQATYTGCKHDAQKLDSSSSIGSSEVWTDLGITPPYFIDVLTNLCSSSEILSGGRMKST